MNEQLSIALFRASPLPSLVLKPDSPHFTIVAANDAYLRETRTTEKVLVGRGLFEAFPDNPNDKLANGVQNLGKSLDTVIQTKKAHKMEVQKYDISMRSSSAFEVRYWVPENVPVLNEKKEVELIIHTVHDLTRQVLREVENTLMFNNTQESIVLVNADLKIVNFNRQFFENYKAIFGKEVKKNASIIGYAQPDRRNAVAQIYQQVLNGETHTFELNIPDKKQQRYFHLVYKPARNTDGSIFGAFVSILEITTEKEAQRQLSESEKRFRALVENSGDAVVIFSSKGKTIYASPTVKRLLGYEENDVLETTIFSVIHPDDLKQVRKMVRQSVDNPRTPIAGITCRVQHKNTTWRWIEATITNMLDEPSVNGIVNNFRDVTEKVEAENALANSRNKYQGLVQAIDGIVWEADPETFEFNYVSPKAEKILGFPIADWYGNSTFWTNHIHPDDREWAINHCVQQAKTRDNYSFEYRMIAKNGRIVWIRDVVSVIRKKKKQQMLRGLMVDITEQKHAEDLLKESNERFEYAAMATKDAIYDWEIEQDNIHWGKGYNTLFGHKINEKDYPLEKWIKNIHPDDVIETNESLINAIEQSNDTFWSKEYRLRKKDGTYAHVIESGYIVRNQKEKAIRMIGAIRDISEKKHLENLLDAAHHLARVGGWEVDLVNDKVSWTSITREIHEVDDDYIPDLESGINFYKEGENRKKIRQATNDAIKTGKFYDLELQIVTAKGNERWIRTIGETEMIKGKCVRLFGSFQDIHHRKMAEIKLKELSLVAAKTADIVIITDADGKITWVNQAYEKHTGYLLEESLGKNPGKLLQGPETDPETVKKLGKAIRNFESINEIILNYTKTGEKYWLDLTVDPVFDEAGKCTHFIGIERDVSRAKYASDLEVLEKEVLQISNRKESSLEEIFAYYIQGIERLHPDMICSIVRVEEDGRMYNWYSDRLPESFISGINGQSAGPNAGSCGTAAFYKQDVIVCDIENDTRWKDYKEYALNEGLRACWSHPLIDNSGRVMATFATYYRYVKSPSPREENIIERATNLLQIILEKYYAERAIEEAFEERETIFRSISDAFYSVNTKWKFTYFNKEAERLLRKSATEVIGKNIWDVFAQAKDTELYEKYYNALINNQPDAFEFYYPDFNTWFDISVYPSPKGISVYFKDINIRKEAERQINKMNEELKKRAEELTISNKELEQFAYVASHDLQEPLRMINGFLLRLQKKYEEQLDDRAHLYIKFAVDGAVRMRKIILDLLEYSRAGKKEYDKEDLDMNQLMEELVKFSALNIRRKEATIKWKKLPVIRAARVPIQQLMQNLLSNALKYRHHDRKPLVKIDCQSLSGYWKFTVADNGIGIEPRFFEKIFIIFQRLHNKEEYSGTGIGLAICKKIVENHDGEIWVESEPGIGSTFIFTLPK